MKLESETETVKKMNFKASSEIPCKSIFLTTAQPNIISTTLTIRYMAECILFWHEYFVVFWDSGKEINYKAEE